MKQKIENIELKALKEIVSETSQKYVSEKTGVGQNSISEYISGITTNWTDSTYKKLLPLLKPKLPTSYKIHNSHIHNSTIHNSISHIDSVSKQVLAKKIRSSDLKAEDKLKVLDMLDEL